jgi:hypothetical protein
MSILHNLPLDVIRKHIFPKLDWSSRVTANILLNPGDRLRFPLKKDAGISIMIRKEHDIIKRKLYSVIPTNSPQKNYQNIVTLMNAMKEVRYLLQHSLGFRNTFITKCQSFADLDSAEYASSTISDEEKQSLSALCLEVLEHVESLPFQHEVVSSNDTWTAVTAGPPHIVEQTVYKVYHGYRHIYEEYEYDWEAIWSRRND